MKNVPYLIAPENINRCKLKVPRNARICASRVVEYVPQYDEQISPRNFVPAERLTPVSTALPADPAPDNVMKNRASYTWEIFKIFLFSFFYHFGYHYIHHFFYHLFYHLHFFYHFKNIFYHCFNRFSLFFNIFHQFEAKMIKHD